MALTVKRLAAAQQLPSSAGSLYANPAATRTYIKEVILYNSNTAAEAVALYLVPAGGSAAAGNQVLARVINPGETFVLAFAVGLILEASGDFLAGSTTTAAKVACHLMGAVDA